MLKRHEIKALLKAGHTQTEVARLVGVSRRSVQRVALEGVVARPVDEHAARQARSIGRPSLVGDFRKFVVDLIEQEPTLKSVEVFRRAGLAGYAGRKSALYALIASVRPRDVVPRVRVEGVPGEFSQHDFGEVDVEYLDGTDQRLRFFASRLKYSRAMQVALVRDQTVESLLRSLATHLAAWGGAPLVCTFDRPKTVALKWGRDGVVAEWNATFANAALELGIGVDVGWPSRAQEKWSGENLVGFVKGSFFKPRRFHDFEDLQQQLGEWLLEVNEQRPCRATRIVPAVRLAEERPRLRPLKVSPDQFALRVPIYVGPTATVVHDTHPYAMPPEAIGIAGTLYLYATRVRIVAGRFDIEHPRQWMRWSGSIRADHRAAVTGKRGKRYLKRQQLLDLGEPALAYLIEVVHRRPTRWIHDVDRLHELLQVHGPNRLRAAFVDAVQRQQFGGTAVRDAIARGEREEGLFA